MKLAGEEGLEPSNVGIKIRCLNHLGDSPKRCRRQLRVGDTSYKLLGLRRAARSLGFCWKRRGIPASPSISFDAGTPKRGHIFHAGHAPALFACRHCGPLPGFTLPACADCTLTAVPASAAFPEGRRRDIRSHLARRRGRRDDDVERGTRFELATSTLARLRSTN